jgi:hypothetical protein
MLTTDKIQLARTTYVVASCYLMLMLLAMLGAASASYAADASSCYAISSSDQRAFCLAKARGEPSMCYAIADGSLRSECLAEVRK